MKTDGTDAVDAAAVRVAQFKLAVAEAAGELSPLEYVRALIEEAHWTAQKNLSEGTPTRHDHPHRNDSGGCLCSCRHCLAYFVEPHPSRPGVLCIRRKCICIQCSEDCPGERTDVLGAGVVLDVVPLNKPAVRLVVEDVNHVVLLDQLFPLSVSGNGTYRYALTLTGEKVPLTLSAEVMFGD